MKIYFLNMLFLQFVSSLYHAQQQLQNRVFGLFGDICG